MEARGRWTPAIVAAVVFAAVVVAATVGGRSSAEPDVVPGLTIAADTVPATSLPAAPSVVTVPEETPAAKTTLSATLTRGMSGRQVEMVQQRLVELGFDPGPVDGIFGELTEKAVWAFEKLVMDVPRADATGYVTDPMWQRMQDAITVAPRRPNSTPTHMEIYLPEQVAIVFTNDVPRLITHVSTGSGEEWCEEVTIQPGEWNNPGDEPLVRGECGVSVTPGGVFEFYRRYEGNRVGSLGGMYNPVYFNYGIAVHGSDSVPLEPASHGCVRIPDYIAEYFPSLVANGDQVFVFDGVKEPEEYGAQLPVFNRIDPDYSTTTSSTSSTTSTTTTVPEESVPTTRPRPTTTRPGSTTTVPQPTRRTTTTVASTG